MTMQFRTALYLRVSTGRQADPIFPSRTTAATRRNALLERLRQSFAAIQRFTGDASHQIRTPLTIVRTHLDVVRRPGTGTNEGRAALDDAEEARGGWKD